MSYIDTAVSALKEFEGVIDWMYLDTNGYVTVGVGDMLPDVAAALQLPFMVSGAPATPAQISSEYVRVSAMPKAQLAAHYKTSASPLLSAEGVDTQLRKQVASFEGFLGHIFPAYATLPDTVKEALIDMVFNLGPFRLQHGFPHFCALINAGKFVEAAAASHRNGPSETRNTYVRNLLLHS